MPVANQTLIRVGHPAYKGANAQRVCFSKAQAVRVLRNRGIKLCDARKAVEIALRDGGSTAKPNILDQIEVSDMTKWQGHDRWIRAEFQAIWRNQPEQ